MIPAGFPASALDWLRRVTGAQIGAITRLAGATSSSLYALDGAAGERYVLRLFSNADWLADQPDLALHEASSLRKLQGGGLTLTPRLVGLDEDGAQCGVPALLMTRLPGAVQLSPPDLDGWLGQMADFLARLHALPLADHPWTYFPYNERERLSLPDWAPDKAAWRRALAIGTGPLPPFEPCFIHRDYHPVNVLFQDGQLSGVVDWPNACIGPAGVDVAHCRANLAAMYGVGAADRFLALCQQRMGGYWQYDPFWDLMTILDGLPGAPDVYPPWLDFGLSQLTPALMLERSSAYLESVLARF